MIYWASPFTEAEYVPVRDPQREDARSRWLAALERDGTSRGSQHVPVPHERTQIPAPSPERGEEGPLTVSRLLAFGVLTWTLGIMLGVIDEEGRFSRASAITVLLLLGCLAFLAGLAAVARRTRPTTKHILVEADIRDPVTGLPNERYLILRLEEEIGRVHRYERPLTLAVLDINSLSAVNEQYGRDCGDEVLRHVAAVAQETKRSSDVLVRMSDDRFAIILSECDSDGGQAFIGRLTERMAQQPARVLLNNRPSHVWVGVCVGLAGVESEKEAPESLLERACADLEHARDERDRRRQRWRAA